MVKVKCGIRCDGYPQGAKTAFFIPVLLGLGVLGITLYAAAQSPDTVQRIQQLLQAGDPAEAQSLLSQALREAPTSGGLYNLQGVLEAQKGDVAGAVANFRKAIQLAPRLEGAYLNLGHLYQEQVPKDPAARGKALSVYASLLQFAPDHLEANYQSAVLLMQMRLYRESLDHLTKLPEEARSHPQTLSVRCGDYAGLDQFDKATKAADQMLSSSSLAGADVTSILPILASQRGTALAIKLLEGLAARHLTTFDSLRTLGLLYRRSGRFVEARQALESAAMLQPNSVRNLLDLARVAEDQKDHAGALGYLAHARDLDPNNASIHFFWGMVCIEQDLAQEAYEALKKAVSLNPQNAYYNYAMGIVTMQRKDAAESIPYLKKYCELKPQDPHGRLALGVAYFNSLDDESAQKTLSAAASNRSTAAVAYFYRGRIANREGRYPDALHDLNLALQNRPDYADAYAELGVIHLKRREYAAAEEALEKALKLNPESYAANLNLMVLYQRTKNPKAEEQAKRFAHIKEESAKRALEFMRTIGVRP
jgi:tetratricopeptide (TPR) repeat protein